MTSDALQPHILASLELIATRLQAEPTLPWLIGGALAQSLQGVERDDTDDLLLITGAAEVGRVAALLAAEEVMPLAMQAAAGFGTSPRGRYQLQLPDGASVFVDLVGDMVVVGKVGSLSLALERIWPLRIPLKLGDSTIPLVPLEIELASELLRDHATHTHAIASYLLERGAQWDRLDPILAQLPALETPLWDVMDVVRPMAKRARGRRKRQQIGWGGRRR